MKKNCCWLVLLLTLRVHSVHVTFAGFVDRVRRSLGKVLSSSVVLKRQIKLNWL
jgi:hypothetical protein